MRTILFPKKETWDALCRRPVRKKSELDSEVRDIIGKVRSEGDKALRDYSVKFDRVNISSLKVTPDELNEAEELVTPELKNAINTAMENIIKFHEVQIVKEKPG